MPYTRVWDEADPQDIDPALTLGDIIRDLKVDWRERINTILGLAQGTAFADPVIGFYDAGNSGTSKIINWANGPVQKVTMTDNCTFTFQNPVAGRPYVLIMIQDGTGGRTATLTGFNFGDGAFVPNTGAGLQNTVTGLYDGTEYHAGTFATGV